MKKKRVNISISDELHKELKKQSIDENITFSELLDKLGRDYLEKQPKDRNLSSQP